MDEELNSWRRSYHRETSPLICRATRNVEWHFLPVRKCMSYYNLVSNLALIKYNYMKFTGKIKICQYPFSIWQTCFHQVLLCLNWNCILNTRFPMLIFWINFTVQFQRFVHLLLARIFLFKVNNRSTKTMCKICSKLANKETSFWCHWPRSVV